MSSIIVVVGSMASATRLARRINRSGKSARVISTPANLRTNEGCSYSVRTELSAKNIIANSSRGLTVRGIYIEDIVGEKRVYNDIS